MVDVFWVDAVRGGTLDVNQDEWMSGSPGGTPGPEQLIRNGRVLPSGYNARTVFTTIIMIYHLLILFFLNSLAAYTFLKQLRK